MNYLVGGKLLETIGALFIAYVAVRACALEMKSGYHSKRQSAETHRRQDDSAVDETENLRKGLRQVLDQRHRQFGFYEALLVGSGTMLVALGCVLYLVGVLIESH
jgi:hypothetical protein